MEFILIATSVIILLYILALGFLIYRWTSLAQVAVSQNVHLKFSILIPFRNESERITPMLESLINIRYPEDCYEVVFIDDHSSDNSVSVIKNTWPGKTPWRVVHLPEGVSGKKRALELGVSCAAYERIITTDADCIVSPGWLESYNACFNEKEPKFISGPLMLSISRYSLIEVFQYFEQTALTAIGGLSIDLGIPTMCNGANIGFTKSSFIEVGGYNGNEHIPTGDDQFLLSKMASAFPEGICFLSSAGAVVATPAVTSLAQLQHQRVRWASKWRATGGWVAGMAVFIGITYVSQVILVISLFLAPQYLLPVLFLFIIKMTADAVFVWRASYSRNRWKLLLWWPLIQIIYPVYAMIIGMRSSAGTYTWKGRQYSAMG